MPSKPFQRGPFAQLPAKPHRPHPYATLAAREVVVDSQAFGKTRIHYREFGPGDAPPLLLIHGLMTSSYSWRYVVEALGAHYRVLIPDLPGAGRSDHPDVDYAPAKLAAFIGELQGALGIRGCLAVGNSLGGYLCMRLALADPGAFSRLVNIHSPGFPIAKIRALAVALAIPGMRGVLDWMIRRDPLRWVHKNVHYYDESLKSLEEAHEYGDPLATEPGRRAFIHYLTDTMAPRAFAELVSSLHDPFPIPLMLLYSRQDPLVPPETGAKLHALLPSAQLVWLDDTSHFAHVDTPAKVLAPVLTFLAGSFPDAAAQI